MEILAPVGNKDALLAAVYSGANAVYLGGKSFGARRNAGNFDNEELVEAINFCHENRVKVYVTVNIMIKQDEIKDLVTFLTLLALNHVDGIIVQDLAIAKIVSESFPTLPLHASTQMSIHHASALPLLKKYGFKRVVVAREMNKNELKVFCQKAKEWQIEVEYFVHGALCMSVSGQCLLSAMLGSRSGNRGLCAQPCRLPFKAKGSDLGYDLSLKDLSMFDHLKELEELGVNSLKIEGRMKRPEYVALATHCCRQALDNQQVDTKLLQDIFSRTGFTDGYYTGKLGKEMFGTRTTDDIKASEQVNNQIHELYRHQSPNTPLDMVVDIRKDEPMRLTVEGENFFGEHPLTADNRPTTVEMVKDTLSKLGNTPYYCHNIEVNLDDNLFVRNAQLNQLKHQAIQYLNQQAIKTDEPIIKAVNYSDSTRLHSLNKTYIRIANKAQYSEILEDVDGVIIPIDMEITDQKANFIVEIPRWINDEEYVRKQINEFIAKGINKFYANNISALMILADYECEIMTGNNMNIANSEACSLLENEKVKSITISLELNFKEIDRIKCNCDKGIIAYGYVPLMLLKNCPLKNGQNCADCDSKGYLVDRMNIRFPVRCYQRMSELFNSTPIYLADKLADAQNLDYIILYFTSESQKEIEEIIDHYRNERKTNGDFTRGLYYRSVL